MKVLKFGGTSIQDPGAIRKVADIVREGAGEGLVLVFSAMGSTTDRLGDMGAAASRGEADAALEMLEALRAEHLSAADALVGPGSEEGRAVRAECGNIFAGLAEVLRGIAVLRDFSRPVQDRVLGAGELLSTAILCAFLRREGLPATWVDARDFVLTDARHTEASPRFGETAGEARRHLLPLLERGEIPVTQGFIGRGPGGIPTTLGRGGSDYSASLLGAALGAREIQIWTDVDGVMTADPSLVPGARSIPEMSFREASELALFGARVLHPKTLAPAVERGIPVRVLNTRRPSGAGTLILPGRPGDARPARSIAYKEGVTVVNLLSARMFQFRGFLGRVSDVLERHGLAPDLVSTSLVSVAMAFHGEADLGPAMEELWELGEVTLRPGQAVVSVVGEGLRGSRGTVGHIFEELGDVAVAMVAQGGAEVNVSFVVPEGDLPKVVSRLHRRFFEHSPPRIPGANPPEAHLYV